MNAHSTPYCEGRTLKDKIFFFSSLALLICAFAAIIYYICGPSRGYLHSDCTDSLYWANASIESGRLIADNFRYAALLPFSANLWMIPLIKIFGFGMTAQTVSMVIFAALYLASQIWLFRSLRFSWTMSFTSSALLLMLLSSSTKLREIMWEHVIYYSLAIVFFNCLIALSLSLIRAWESYKNGTDAKAKTSLIVYAVLLAVASACISTNGLPIIVMTTLPVCLGIAAELIFDTKNKLFCKNNLAKLGSVAGIAIFSAIGFALLQLLKGGVVADYTNIYSQFSLSKDWWEHIFLFPTDLLTLMGFTDTAAKFTSLDGILAFLTIVVTLLILLVPTVALFFYKRIKNAGTRIVLLSHTILFAVLLFMFIFGNISNANWRLVPLLGSGAIATLCVANELLVAYKESKREGAQINEMPLRICALTLAVLALFSSFTFVKIAKMPVDYGRDNTLHQLTALLEENELEYGYATFWNSQAITLLSDERVKCREILATATKGAQTDYYQSSYDWYGPQENVEQYFVLLSKHEYNKVRQNPTWIGWEENQLSRTIEAPDGYIIFVFNGYLEGIK